MLLNIENIDVAMSSFEQPKLTSKMLYHQNLDLKKKIHFNCTPKHAITITNTIQRFSPTMLLRLIRQF